MSSFSSPRAKLVLAVFTAIGAIAALHFLLFRDNAQAFQMAESEYREEFQKLEQLGRPKPTEDVYRFQYQTINYELQFWELLRKARLSSPEEFFVITSTPEEAKREKERQVLLLWDFLKRIEQMRDEGDSGPTKLTFLESDQPWNRDPSWSILRRLPDTVTRGEMALSDRVRELMDSDALLDNIPKDTLLWEDQNRKYSSLLFQIGLNLIRRDGPPIERTAFQPLQQQQRTGIQHELGKAVAALYTLNRIDLIKRSIPRQEFGFQTEEAYNRRMFDLFRLDYENLDTFNAYKQLEALVDVLEVARKHQIAEVQRVKLWDMRELRWPPPELEEKPEGAVDGMFPGMEGMEGMMMDPSLFFMMGGMEQGMDPAAMGMDPAAMGVDPDMMGMMFGMEGMGMTATAEEEQTPAYAGAVPIEITVRGSNRNVMAFLYEITHNNRTWEIDAIDVAALPREENRVAAKVVLKVISYFSDFTPTEQQIDENVLRLLQKKKEIASRPGAIELAREEGFLERMADIPDPDPATLAPVVDPAMGAMDQGMGMDLF